MTFKYKESLEILGGGMGDGRSTGLPGAKRLGNATSGAGLHQHVSVAFMACPWSRVRQNPKTGDKDAESTCHVSF